MPTLDVITQDPIIKMLLIGDSGTGKSGALASLALAGYQLRILDFDKGCAEVIKGAILEAGKPEAMKNVIIQPMDDQLQILPGKIIPRGVPQSFQNALKLMENWSPKSVKTADELGSPSKWGSNCVLVIDSLTHLCNAALAYVQVANSNAGGQVTQPEWGNAQRMVEQMLTLLYSSEFHTNVIVISHVTYDRMDNQVDDKGNPTGEVKGNPTSLGRALPPKIPSYFNHMLMCEKSGMGSSTQRNISTVPNMQVNAKSPLMKRVPAKLPITTGLATYFDIALGRSSGVVATPSTAAGVVPAAATK